MEKHRNDFQRRVAALSDRTWNAIQLTGGAILGGAVAFFLIGGTSDDSQFVFALYALVLALFVPKALEKACDRSLSRGQTVMLIAIAVAMVVHVVIAGSRQGFSLT